MLDDNGFAIRCEHARWAVIDNNDNQDYVCDRYTTTGAHVCYCDKYCKDYKPIKEGTNGEIQIASGK